MDSERFVSFYEEGPPPWDIPGPQPVIAALEESGKIRGSVLDAGCGTGENAMMLAAKGNRVLGIDSAPRAIARARSKAKERGSMAEFRVADALRLQALGMQFDAAIDCGLFHTLSDDQRGIYAASLKAAIRPGGRCFILCFNEQEPADWGGPRRVTKAEILETFSDGWRVDAIDAAKLEGTGLGEGGRAWLACLTRLG